MYVPKKDRQLGCQRANSHQAGTVESRVDHNEQGIKPETYQGSVITLNCTTPAYLASGQLIALHCQSHAEQLF